MRYTVRVVSIRLGWGAPMPTGDDNSEIVELLVTHEKILAELYLLYAERYDEHDAFWMQLHHDELVHVDLIRSLNQRVAQGVALFNAERLDVGALQAVVRYARSMLNYVRQQWPTLAAAVAIAIDLEDSIIEKGIFEIFVADSPETSQAFAQMIETFDEHMKSLRRFQAFISPKKKPGTLQ